MERQVALDVWAEHHALAASAAGHLAPVCEHLHGGEAGSPRRLVDRREPVVAEVARLHTEVVQLRGGVEDEREEGMTSEGRMVLTDDSQ